MHNNEQMLLKTSESIYINKMKDEYCWVIYILCHMGYGYIYCY